jgi:hypothetical protein
MVAMMVVGFIVEVIILFQFVMRITLYKHIEAECDTYYCKALRWDGFVGRLAGSARGIVALPLACEDCAQRHKDDLVAPSST